MPVVLLSDLCEMFWLGAVSIHVLPSRVSEQKRGDRSHLLGLAAQTEGMGD